MRFFNKNFYLKFALFFSFIFILAILASNLNITALLSHQDKLTIKDLGAYNHYDTSENVAIFNNQKVSVNYQKTRDQELGQVLGENDSQVVTNVVKRIAVDLTHQRLMAFENDKLKFFFPVSTGKWGRTPTGVFQIWSKFKYTKMSGGSRALHTYYYLPNVPFVMFFSNNQIAPSMGFSLHGTYWHDNFGHPMSHGCVNMITEDAERLFYWTGPDLDGKTTVRASKENPGTKILIYGKTPTN